MASLGKVFVAELIGTFIFLGVIMHVVSKSERYGMAQNWFSPFCCNFYY